MESYEGSILAEDAGGYANNDASPTGEVARLATGHYPHLQAARGIAALLVVLHHASVLFATSGVLAVVADASPAFAHTAVVFFFVLSGFVLSRSLQHRPAVAEFYIRRICRIYPCLWLAVAISLLVPYSSHAKESVSWADLIWAEHFYRSPSALKVVAGLLGVHVDTDLVPPAWSISVELVASLLLPPLLLLRRRLWVAALLTIAWIVALPIYFGVYVLSFFAGVWLSSAHLTASPAAGLIAVVSMLTVRWTHAWAYHAVLPTIFETGCAAVVISSLVSNPPRWLEHRLLLRLGDISYSVYLLHFPIMAALALVIGRLFSPNAATLVLIAVFLPTIIAAAEISFRLVEVPGIRLGRLAVRALAGRHDLGEEAGRQTLNLS